MNKTFKIYGVILIIVLVLIAILEINKSKVIDWEKNFRTDSKTPFGLYVFHQEAESLFKNRLEKSAHSPYHYYSNDSTQAPHNILVIARYLDNGSLQKILKEVRKGSNAMISYDDYYNTLISDTLKADISPVETKFTPSLLTDEETHFTLKFTDKKLEKDSIVLDKEHNKYTFYNIHKDAELLGSTYIKNNKIGLNFIKIKHGKGNFYLHTEPLVFTNYYLLKKNNKAYSEHLLSYLPNDRKTIWFLDDLQVSSASPMRFILSKPALKYAWWIFLGGILIFIIFNAKRKQRIVPIIEPKKNQSVEFVKSIGNLYLNEGDFRDMMSKKAIYFLNRVRIELMIDTQNLDENFVKKLHLKTGKPIETISKGIEYIKKIKNNNASITKADLIQMNKILDEIF